MKPLDRKSRRKGERQALKKRKLENYMRAHSRSGPSSAASSSDTAPGQTPSASLQTRKRISVARRNTSESDPSLPVAKKERQNGRLPTNIVPTKPKTKKKLTVVQEDRITQDPPSTSAALYRPPGVVSAHKSELGGPAGSPPSTARLDSSVVTSHGDASGTRDAALRAVRGVLNRLSASTFAQVFGELLNILEPLPAADAVDATVTALVAVVASPIRALGPLLIPFAVAVRGMQQYLDCGDRVVASVVRALVGRFLDVVTRYGAYASAHRCATTENLPAVAYVDADMPATEMGLALKRVGANCLTFIAHCTGVGALGTSLVEDLAVLLSSLPVWASTSPEWCIGWLTGLLSAAPSASIQAIAAVPHVAVAASIAFLQYRPDLAARLDGAESFVDAADEASVRRWQSLTGLVDAVHALRTKSKRGTLDRSGDEQARVAAMHALQKVTWRDGHGRKRTARVARPLPIRLASLLQMAATSRTWWTVPDAPSLVLDDIQLEVTSVAERLKAQSGSSHVCVSNLLSLPGSSEFLTFLSDSATPVGDSVPDGDLPNTGAVDQLTHAARTHGFNSPATLAAFLTLTSIRDPRKYADIAAAVSGRRREAAVEAGLAVAVHCMTVVEATWRPFYWKALCSLFNLHPKALGMIAFPLWDAVATLGAPPGIDVRSRVHQSAQIRNNPLARCFNIATLFLFILLRCHIGGILPSSRLFKALHLEAYFLSSRKKQHSEAYAPLFGPDKVLKELESPDKTFLCRILVALFVVVSPILPSLLVSLDSIEKEASSAEPADFDAKETESWDGGAIFRSFCLFYLTNDVSKTPIIRPLARLFVSSIVEAFRVGESSDCEDLAVWQSEVALVSEEKSFHKWLSTRVAKARSLLTSLPSQV